MAFNYWGNCYPNIFLISRLNGTEQAYPVMAVIVGSVFLVLGRTVHVMFHPDVRVSKTSRKKLFRGDVEDVQTA